MYLFIRWIGLMGLVLAAAPTLAEQTELFIIPQMPIEVLSLPPIEHLTPQLLEAQQQTLQQLPNQLDEHRQILHQYKQRLHNQMTNLEKKPQAVTANMLELAAQQRTLANAQVDKLRQQRQEVQTQLNHHIQFLEKHQEQRTAHEAKIKLSQQAIQLAQRYLNVLDTQMELLNQQLILTIQWHDKLQLLHQQRLIEERQQLLEDAQRAVQHHQHALITEKKNLPNKIATLETLPITMEMLEQASLDKETIAIEIENLGLERQSSQANLERQTKSLKEQKEKLENLQKMPAVETAFQAVHEQRISGLEDNIQLQKQTLALEQQHLEILKNRTELAEKRLLLAEQWYEKLQTAYQQRQKQDLETQIQQEQQRYLTQAATLRKQLAQLPEATPAAQLYLLETQIQHADELAQQVVRQLKLEHMTEQFKQWQHSFTEANHVDQHTLKNMTHWLAELRSLKELLTHKIKLLQQQQTVTQKRQETSTQAEHAFYQQAQQILLQLEQQLSKQQQYIAPLVEQGRQLAGQIEAAYKHTVQQALLRRRQLPTETAEWQKLLAEIATIPSLVVAQAQLTWRSYLQAFQRLSYQNGFIFLFIASIFLGIVTWGHRRLSRILNIIEKGRRFVATNLLLGLQLLHQNSFTLAFAVVFLALISLIQPAPASLFLTLIGLFFVVIGKILINLSGLLLSRIQHHKLHVQLRNTIIFTLILTFITTLAHVNWEGYLLTVSLKVQDLIDSLFMLFLSLTVLPVMRLRRVILTVLEIKLKKRYWLLVIRLITWLLPLSILAVSILGVMGYINLGWQVAKHLSLFLLVLTGWLIARGLLNDAMNLLKNFALRHSNYGLLWTQDIIPLVYRVLALGLFGLALWILFWLNGWYQADDVVRAQLESILNYRLLSLGNSAISVGNLLLALLLLVAIFWLGRWSRQITYRWIYIKILDLGVRHSLSVFTQYTVVLIGLLIVLRMINIDLTTLTVFAGALGVGIGFGLQNIANNFISGILLLMERPLRTGDIINVGGSYEGTVMKIGIRSLTIKTWASEEVIVPNSDLISNAFINWTHSDPIMRTTLYIHISHDDDPHQVETLLNQVMSEFTEILTEPPVNVYVWELGHFAIIFRIDYFINLHQASRFRVKSNVLLSIWQRLRQAGIKVPYPQQDIHVRSIAQASQGIAF